MPTMQNVIGPAISSAMQGSKLAGEVQQGLAEARNAQSQNKVIENTADNLTKQGGLIGAQTGAAQASASASAASANASNATAAQIQQAIDKREKYGAGQYGAIAETLDRTDKAVGLSNFLNSLSGFGNSASPDNSLTVHGTPQ